MGVFHNSSVIWLILFYRLFSSYLTLVHHIECTCTKTFSENLLHFVISSCSYPKWFLIFLIDKRKELNKSRRLVELLRRCFCLYLLFCEKINRILPPQKTSFINNYYLKRLFKSDALHSREIRSRSITSVWNYLKPVLI